jgi:hypothetical protein
MKEKTLLQAATEILSPNYVVESDNPFLDGHMKKSLELAKAEFVRTFLNSVLEKLDNAKKSSVIDTADYKKMEKQLYAIAEKLKKDIFKVKFSIK